MHASVINPDFVPVMLFALFLARLSITGNCVSKVTYYTVALSPELADMDPYIQEYTCN